MRPIRVPENGRDFVKRVASEILARLDRALPANDCAMAGKDITDCRLIIEPVVGHILPEADDLAVIGDIILVTIAFEDDVSPQCLADEGQVNVMLVEGQPLGPLVVKHL